MMKAKVGCDVISGEGAVQERFEWFENDVSVDVSTYPRGQITIARRNFPENTAVRLKVTSIASDGAEASSEVMMAIGMAPPAGGPTTLGAPQLSGLYVEGWVDE